MTRSGTVARVAAALGVAVLSASSAQAALPDATKAPDFTLPATLGGKEFRFSLADALRHGPVVLYFYPAAFTKGCTVEAHDFAEAIPAYRALGASVVGVSTDKIGTLDRFSVSACQSQFPVAADSDRKVSQAYDAVLLKFPSLANRTSYVIVPGGPAGGGTVLYSYTALAPDAHVDNTLAALKAWRARGR
jgi:thioredoxin-dependent peroxiredoxin